MQMPRDDLALYLNLSHEFGGGRFGPFEGLEVRLGSDRERCHVVLPESFGVTKQHCKLIRQGDGGLILAASERTAAGERTAAVFVWKGDAVGEENGEDDEAGQAVVLLLDDVAAPAADRRI